MADDRRTVLVTGAGGLVGGALSRLDWPEDVRLHAVDRRQLDIRDRQAVDDAIRSLKPAVIVNAAAYTHVDQAEDDAAEAFATNDQGAANLAEAARAVDGAMLHISTDYVFDGRKGTPYVETDRVAPLGVYGASKLAGEAAVRRERPGSIILRTGWLFASEGGNFAASILRRARGGEPIAVVDDQHGSPTTVDDLAHAARTVVMRQLRGDAPAGVYHFAGMGQASRHDVAVAVLEAAFAGSDIPAVRAVRTADYPARAVRPACSALCSDAFARDFGLRARSWRQAIGDIFGPVSKGGSV